MKWYNKIGLIIVIAYTIAATALSIYFGIWEYGPTTTFWKAHYIAHGEPIYPDVLNQLSHPWIYTPISAILYTYLYIVSLGNEHLFALIGSFIFIGTGIIIGVTASKLYKKDITFLTAGVFLFPILITWQGTQPRPDTLAVFFLALAINSFVNRDNKKTALFYALSFLSKQTYVFTIPLLYLFSGRWKQAIKVSIIPVVLFALLLVGVPHFKDNVIYYVLGSDTGRDCLTKAIYSSVVILSTTGLPLFIIGLRKQKPFFYTAIMLTIIITLLSMNAGASYYYFFPLLAVSALGSNIITSKKFDKYILTVVPIILLATQVSIEPFVLRAMTVKEVKSLVDEKLVFSGDSGIDSDHIDYYYYNMYYRAGVWDWKTITTRFSEHYYDYIVVSAVGDTSSVNFYFARVAPEVYTEALSYYTDYTTIWSGQYAFFVLTPKTTYTPEAYNKG